jgi:predicted nucleic acid-binding protein
MSAEEAEEVLRDLEGWTLHLSSLAGPLSASRLHRRHKISWRDALIVNSAIELDCEMLWSEDLAHGQKYGSITVHNPFSDK